MVDPIRPTDADARALAGRLSQSARVGALGTLDPTGYPVVSRAAVLADGPDLLALLSSLAPHAGNLRADPRCSVLVGMPADKGDPLASPRMTLIAVAEVADKAAWRDRWLTAHPKARLYYDFADFALFRLRVTSAQLNGGFGRAFRLTREELEGAGSGVA